MFEDKPKPADKGDKAAANLAKGAPKKSDRSNCPPIDKKKLEALNHLIQLLLN